jgi:hypothetical protein
MSQEATISQIVTDFPSGLPALQSVSDGSNSTHAPMFQGYGSTELDVNIQTVLIELQFSREKVAWLEAKLVDLCRNAAIGHKGYSEDSFDLKVFEAFDIAMGMKLTTILV